MCCYASRSGGLLLWALGLTVLTCGGGSIYGVWAEPQYPQPWSPYDQPRPAGLSNTTDWRLRYSYTPINYNNAGYRFRSQPAAGAPGAGGSGASTPPTFAGTDHGVAAAAAAGSVGASKNLTEVGHEEPESIHVASWNWQYVRTPFIYTAFVVIAGLCKVGFHHANFLSTILPESCLLILLGTLIGAILYHTGMESSLPHFESRAFFLYLLPPIMLESAYSLHDRAFSDNIGTILLYAVVGTLISCFTIGPTLYGLSLIGGMGNFDIPLVQALVFSAFISAVDPVAVLAIFQEVGVNKDLYFLVFGESLLNDAVTVVLYNAMVAFTTMKRIPFNQIMLGIAAFICSSLGGLTIGTFFGVMTSLLTKYTEEVRVVEPLALMGMAYLSYLTAEMVHFSGIISIIACGLMQMQYAKNNISMKSYITVKYFSKMLSATCDCIIFLFLGMVLITDQHDWQTGFVLWSIILCLVYRFITVFALTFIANVCYRSRKIGFKEQFIMAYGGLRGAVCFSLVMMLDSTSVPLKQLFVTTTLIIIFFTVFIQGGTIKILVKCLEIQMDDGDSTKSLSLQLNSVVIDNIMAGVEQIVGRHGDFHLKQIADHYDEKLKKWLQRSQTDLFNLCKTYEKLAIDDHYAHLYGPATAIEDCKKLSLYGNENEIITEVGYQEPISVEEQEPASVSVPIMPSKETSVYINNSAVPFPAIDDSTSRAIVNFKKAIQDNPYNKYHQKFNPNLVHDDEQELPVQLRRRRLRSRRLTMTAMSPTISQHSSHSDISEENVVALRQNKVRKQPSFSAAAAAVAAAGSDTSGFAAAEYFKQRARQRRLTMGNLSRAKTIDHTNKGNNAHGLQMGVDFPGLDPSNRPHSTGELEMRTTGVTPLGTIVEVDNGNAVNYATGSGNTPPGLHHRHDMDRRPTSDPNVGPTGGDSSSSGSGSPGPRLLFTLGGSNRQQQHARRHATLREEHETTTPPASTPPPAPSGNGNGNGSMESRTERRAGSVEEIAPLIGPSSSGLGTSLAVTGTSTSSSTTSVGSSSPTAPAAPHRKKHPRISKSKPVDIDDDNCESTV